MGGKGAFLGLPPHTKMSAGAQAKDGNLDQMRGCGKSEEFCIYFFRTSIKEEW